MGSLVFGAARVGALDRTSLSCAKAASASFVQTNLSVFFKRRYKGKALSPSQLMNRLTAAADLMSRCRSFRHVGLLMSRIAFIFPRLTSMPRSEMINPKSLLAGTPNTHFLGLSIILYFQRFANVSFK